MQDPDRLPAIIVARLDLPGAEVARHLIPLGVIAAVTLGAASRLFRRRME
jgi:hypothetical protein